MLRQVRGTKDLIADECNKIRRVIEIVYKVASNYGFTPIETPIFEYAEVFTKTLGEGSDIITKEMYTFLDKSENRLTLRPEFTAAIARSFITNHLSQLPSPLKLICHGPLFRYERPQQGRQRQFQQINCEILGEADYIADLEAISLACNILTELKIKDKVTLELNSLGDDESYKNYRTALVPYLKKHEHELSGESKKRLDSNPLRILDSKGKQDRSIIENAPKIYDYYNNHSANFFDQVKNGLNDLGIKYSINPYLVRGLDYYCHTTFEFTTEKLGAQSAVIAGGRYDSLIAKMGGKPTPAIGLAGGIERISQLITEEITTKTKQVISIIPLGDQAMKKGILLAHKLRSENFTTILLTRGSFDKRFIKSKTSSIVIMLGEQELENNVVTLKDMKSGEQTQVEYGSVVSKVTKILESYKIS